MPDDSPGRYRVLARIDRDGTLALVLVDLTPTDDPTEAYEPVLVRATGYDDDLADRVDSLEPGNVIAAELDWTGADASEAAAFEDLSVERRTRYQFADDVEGLFEAARDAWDEARESGEAMNSRVTRDTDGEPNGALYVFADPEPRDVFEEFRTGRRPIEPLVERVNEQHTGDSDSDDTGGDESGESSDLQTGSLAARLPTEGDDEGDDGEETDPASTTADGPPERDVFVIRPADGAFVVVHIAFRKDGLLAETMRDTYDELAN